MRHDVCQQRVFPQSISCGNQLGLSLTGDLLDGTRIRKGAVDSIIRDAGVSADPDMTRIVEKIARVMNG